jgi:hypothetical protein
MFLTNQQYPFIQLTQFQFHLLFYSVFICWWISGISGLIGYVKQVKYEINESDNQDATIPTAKTIEKELYKLTIDQLLSRSDQLDKVRSNLRNGIAIILGVGTSVLVFVSSLPDSTIYRKEYLVLSAGLLVFLTVLGILFSFSNPSYLIGVSGFGEGLVPYDMTQSEYCEILELMIYSKEQILSRMRYFVGIGLILFMTLSAISFFSSVYTFPIPNDFSGLEIFVINAVIDLSYLLLFVFLAFLAFTVASKYVLGIISIDKEGED